MTEKELRDAIYVAGEVADYFGVKICRVRMESLDDRAKIHDAIWLVIKAAQEDLKRKMQ